jgi:hypothetical protein
MIATVHLQRNSDGVVDVSREEFGLFTMPGYCLQQWGVWFAFDALGRIVTGRGGSGLFGSLHGAARAILRHERALAHASMVEGDVGELAAGRRDA